MEEIRYLRETTTLSLQSAQSLVVVAALLLLAYGRGGGRGGERGKEEAGQEEDSRGRGGRMERKGVCGQKSTGY